jgi:hypothetical protein
MTASLNITVEGVSLRSTWPPAAMVTSQRNNIEVWSPPLFYEGRGLNLSFGVGLGPWMQTDVNRRNIINDKHGRHSDCSLTADKMSGI